MAALPSSIEALLFGKKRQIAGIIPDVTIEEKHLDEMVITDHPVERGSNISDHAFKQPESVTIQFGWSDSSNLLNGVLAGAMSVLQGGSMFDGLQSLNDIYEKLLEMQASAEIFDVGTGRREYTDMIIKSLAVTTNVETEAALICTAVFRKVNIVETQTAQLKADNQADAKKTASAQNGGERSPTPAKPSVAQQLELPG